MNHRIGIKGLDIEVVLDAEYDSGELLTEAASSQPGRRAKQAIYISRSSGDDIIHISEKR